MASIKDCEKARGEAEVKVNSELRKLRKACQNVAPNERLVANLVASLDEAYNRLVGAHVAYVIKLNTELSDPRHVQYIDRVEDAIEEVKNLAQIIIGERDENGSPVEKINKEKLKLDYDLAKVSLEARIAELKVTVAGAMNENQNKEHLRIATELNTYIMTTFRDLGSKLWDAWPDEAAVWRTEHEAVLKEKIPVIEKALADLRRKSPVAAEGRDRQPPHVRHAGAGGIEGEHHPTFGANFQTPRKQTIKLKPLDPPSFDGKAKNYTRFKQRFEEMIVSSYDEMGQLEFLEKALPSKVKDRMSMIQKSPEQLWMQLDEMFADPKIMIREAMEELHSIDAAKLGVNFISKLAATLLDTETLLDANGNGDYLRHPREVAALQQMLPRVEKIEYIKREKSYIGGDFAKLKAFLSERKLEEEQLKKLGTGEMFDNTESEKKKCDYCSRKGHLKADCWKFQKDQKDGKETSGAGRGSGCFRCGGKDHKKDQCPMASGKKGADQETHSNHLRTAECPRCKNAASLPGGCAGCSKSGTSLKHCLAHCSFYMMENVSGKASMVMKSKSCVICLHPNHTHDKCYDKDNPKRECGLDGCKSHHHPTLHGSKDPIVTSCNITVVKPTGGFGSWGKKNINEKFRRCHSTRTGAGALDEDRFVEQFEKERRNGELDEVIRKLRETLMEGDNVMLIIQSIDMVFGPSRIQASIIAFFDPGSTCSLILTEFAEQHKLEGSPVNITIGTVNGEKHRETKLYVVELLTCKGDRRLVRAFGMERISQDIPFISVEGVKHLFSKKLQADWGKINDRPRGAIQLLIGAEVAGYLPEKLESADNLVVLKSEFGSGYALVGTHPNIVADKIVLTEEVQSIRQTGVKVSSQYSNRIHLKEVSYFTNMDFMEAEGMGVEAPRRCKDCRGCTKCSFRGQRHTEKETLEYKMIESGVKYNPERGHFDISYAWIDDPAKLSNNIGQAIKIAENEEKKLAREGLTEEFNDKFEEFIKLGTLREIRQQERDSWVGPAHYVSIQHVYKPGNKTTRLRLVINSSLKCPKCGLSLNDMMCKGPNVLLDIWELLVRFRCYTVALVSDITKAYHSLKTGLLEMHLRRVVWRHGVQGAEWKVYGFLVVAFGDRQAAVLLHIAIRMTCEMYQHIDILAAHKMQNDLFVDDLATGGDTEQVDRFMGEKDIKTLKCSGTMPQIMEKGGLYFKAMQRSGEEDGEALELLGGAVLGVGWSSERDKFFFDLVVNVSNRRRGEPTGPDLTVQTLQSAREAVLTKRICLSITNSIFDPMGLLTPVTINLKVMMKNMFSSEYDLKWDQALPTELRQQWISVIYELVGSRVEFDRGIMPHMACGSPVLAAFWDGSDAAFAAVIYAVWSMQELPVEVRLVVSKARVSSEWDKNTVRQELNGAVLCTRLLVRTVRAMEIKPERVWVVGDSETVLASREKHSGYFSEYYSNRIGETHDNQKKVEAICPVGNEGEWWHISGAENPADRPSRVGSKPNDVGYGSEWQRGKDFLRLPRSLWPLERKFARENKDKVKIPLSEVNKKYRNLPEMGIPRSTINITQLQAVVEKMEQSCNVVVEQLKKQKFSNNPMVERFQGGYITNEWQKLLRMTAVFFRWIAKIAQKKTGDNTISAHHMAVLFWIKQAMVETRKAFSEKKLQKLSLWEHEGMLVVSGRAMEGLQYHFGASYLPVLMSTTRVAELIMLDSHTKDHGGRDTTLVTATQVAWIVGGRRLAGRIVDLCIRCRFLRRKLEGQKMASLPAELVVPAPPFLHVGLDLFGPLEVKKMGGAKTTRAVQGTFKVWGVLILCLNTKAVKLYLAAGYSTAEFLMAFEQFTSDHGKPAMVHSDRGSNLVCAAKEVEVPDLNWDMIVRSSESQTRWIFCPSGCQFRNGAAESFVKKVKKTLSHTYGDKQLTFHELETAMKRAACILNSRPVSAICCRKGGVDPDYITALTPNMMLLGRANNDVPLKMYENTEIPLARLEYVSEVESLFWHQFKVQDFHTLVPTYKWQEAQRNLATGDVVLIKYSSKSKSGEYRLGRVVTVEVDTDKLVRTCTVRYSLVQHMRGKDRLSYKGVTIKYIRVAVQRLVLILPVEEQEDIKPISNEEILRAEKEVKEENQMEVNKLEVKPKSNRINIVTKMLKDRHEFNTMCQPEYRYDEEQEWSAMRQVHWANEVQLREVEYSSEMGDCGICAYCRD